MDTNQKTLIFGFAGLFLLVIGCCLGIFFTKRKYDNQNKAIRDLKGAPAPAKEAYEVLEDTKIYPEPILDKLNAFKTLPKGTIVYQYPNTPDYTPFFRIVGEFSTFSTTTNTAFIEKNKIKKLT